MIEILKDVPDGVVAVRASGTLTHAGPGSATRTGTDELRGWPDESAGPPGAGTRTGPLHRPRRR
jgi:hypothetical protein